MRVLISESSRALGQAAAQHAARLLGEAIAARGEARLLVSTGASQFDTFTALIAQDLDFTKITMFHLDEYIGLPVTHPASFRKYLTERFISQVPLKRAVLVNGEGDVAAEIARLNAEIAKSPIDVGLVGIGENAHIAFNDPPADFDAQSPYIVVTLNESCKRQQVREGWFATLEDVPTQAISMSVSQILKCRAILSCVPYKVKAQAIFDTLTQPLSNLTPATALKTHADVTLYLDRDSASLLPESLKA